MTPARHDYPDLDYELDQLIERTVERIAEKEVEHEPAEWRGDSPLDHIEWAEDQFEGIMVAVLTEDVDEARTQVADVVNHLLMALSQMPSAAYYDETPSPPEADS